MNSKLRKKQRKSLEEADKSDAKRRKDEQAATTDDSASISGLETERKIKLRSKIFGKENK